MSLMLAGSAVDGSGPLFAVKGNAQTGRLEVENYVYNGTIWVPMTQAAGGGSGDGAVLDGTDATKKATVRNSTPGGTDYGLVVRPVGGGDASAANQATGNTTLASIFTAMSDGSQVVNMTPGTGATSLGKAEDAAHTSGDVGILSLGVRRDADTSPVSTDGDYHAPIFDAAGNLKVNVKLGGGAAQYVEDVASVGGETGTVALGVRRDADTSPVSADGDFHTPIFDALGNLKVNVKAGGSSGATPLAFITTPTVAASVHTNGVMFGAKQSIAAVASAGGTVRIRKIMLTFTDGITPYGYLVYFRAALTGTYADNTTPTINGTDALLGAVVIPFDGGAYGPTVAGVSYGRVAVPDDAIIDLDAGVTALAFMFIQLNSTTPTNTSFQIEHILQVL